LENTSRSLQPMSQSSRLVYLHVRSDHSEEDKKSNKKKGLLCYKCKG
jgi:hypothetical protein